MRFGFSRPNDLSFGIQPFGVGDPSGCAFITDVLLANGKPAELTRARWLTSGNVENNGVSLFATWSRPRYPRIVALFGVNLPVGLQCFLSMRPSDNSGTSYEDFSVTGSEYLRRIVELPDGGRLVIFVQPESWPGDGPTCTGAMLSFFNGDGISVPDGALFDQGEFWCSDALTLDVENAWEVSQVDPTLIEQSEASQPFAQRGFPARQYKFTPNLREQPQVYGSDDDDGAIDLEEFVALVNRGQQAVFIPRWIDEANQIDPRACARSVVFGTARKLGGERHAYGPWFNHTEFEVIEAPTSPATALQFEISG